MSNHRDSYKHGKLLARVRQSGVMGGPSGARPGEAGNRGSFDGLLVGWQPGITAVQRANSLAALSLTVRETIETAAMKSSGAGAIEWVDLPPGLSAEQAISILSRRPGISFAEKNWKLESQTVPNDPDYSKLWGMDGDYGSKASTAWARGITGATDIYVGIIDEGYNHEHEDLVENRGTNPGDSTFDGKDNDGNGYIDDVYGWDFSTSSRRSLGDNSVYDGTTDDHGTHVAGTIGAKGDNGKGVVGVNWSVKLLNAKFLGSNGGTTANAIKSVDYFTDLKTRSGIKLVATNNSWGGGGYSQGLYDAIARANAADIFFVAAAGNSNTSTLSYPAGYDLPNVISVASIDSDGARSSFSNYGSSWVDLGAPGGGIHSTLPNNTYGTYSGTSMATPHVAGALALMISAHPSASMAQLKQALFASVAATPSLASVTSTGGRLNVDAAITRLGELVGTSTTKPLISVIASDNQAAETTPESPANSGSFTLTRTGGDTTQSLTVQLTWGGSAENGTDYAQKATEVIFGEGELSVNLQIDPFDDNDFEGTETIDLEIQQAGDNSYALSGISRATVSLADNDPDPNPPSYDYDPIINFSGSKDLFEGTRQMFLDGSFNPGFGQASYAATTSSQGFNLNGGDVLRVRSVDANGSPYSWFFSSKYSLNGVNGLAVFLDQGPTTNLSGGKPGSEDDLVAFLAGWTYTGKTFLGTPGQVSWLQLVN